MTHTEVVVIGGGISGLSAAHYCAEAGRKVLVLEKEQRVGGCLHTVYRGNCRLELGAHSFFNSYGNTLKLMRDCNILDEAIPRAKLAYRLLDKGKLHGIASRLNWLQLFFNLPKLFRAKKQGSTVAEYYSRIMGKGNYDNLFRHFLNAVISQDADNFPADVLFKKRPRDKTVLKNFNLQDGMGRLIDVLRHRLDVRTGVHVDSITAYGPGYRLVLDDGESMTCDHLILAVPAPVAGNLTASTAPYLSEQLKAFGSRRMHSTGVFCNASDLDLQRLAGIVPLDDVFYSMVSMDVIQDETKTRRGFTFHFKQPLPGSAERLSVIRRVLGMTADPEMVYDRETTMPVYTRDHGARVRNLEAVAADKHLYLTGNYLSGLSIEDCVSRSRDIATEITQSNNSGIAHPQKTQT